jgi:inner membrane protein involved in colicin E2 resistance
MNSRIKKVLLFGSAWMIPAVLFSIFSEYDSTWLVGSIAVVIGVAVYELLYGE